MTAPAAPLTSLRCGTHSLDLSRPLLMGIVNVTPDSFSDGGLHADTGAAVAHARALLQAGADILDIGGESTRPGAQPVSLDEELHRVIPVIEALAAEGVPLSIDTYKPEVMRAAVAAGASLINDVFALRQPGALEAAAQTSAAVCLMHMQGTPQTMQADPHYADVVTEVTGFLAQRVAACEAAGIDRHRIVVDPGFGFGKSTAHNIALLRGLGSIVRGTGQPLLAGLSRKSVLGRITAREQAADRVAGSVASALIAVQNGARLLRVHDVAATLDMVRVWQALEAA
ncbi:MAG: dihydropteroate synthase [Betaproteobacteria bacterium]|nr:dihydropteroate synthase [Betaproteobacteria bacterium]